MIFSLLFSILANALEINRVSIPYSISEVKNERNCNASHIFASVSAFETAIAIYNNSKIINYSEQFILSNSTSINCGVGDPATVLAFMVDEGNILEPIYPYYGAKISLPPTMQKPEKLPYFYTTSVTTKEDFDYYLKISPLIVGFIVDDITNFSEYRGGSYTCGEASVNIHYMLAVYTMDSQNQS